MSANAIALLAKLRELLSDPGINLSHIARASEVSYHKIRRFKMEEGELSLAEAEAVHLKLTGTTFIVPQDA